MTSQDQAMLVIYQNNPRDIAEMLLDRYFGRVTVDEYEHQLRLVSGEMSSCPEISTSHSFLPSSAVSSLEF